MSGIGREHGEEVLSHYTQVRPGSLSVAMVLMHCNVAEKKKLCCYVVNVEKLEMLKLSYGKIVTHFASSSKCAWTMILYHLLAADDQCGSDTCCLIALT